MCVSAADHLVGEQIFLDIYSRVFFFLGCCFLDLSFPFDFVSPSETTRWIKIQLSAPLGGQSVQVLTSSSSSPRLAKELQEKNRVIQSLQSQLRGQTPSSHHSSHSDLCHSDRTSSSSCYSSPTTPGVSGARGKHKDTTRRFQISPNDGIY